MNTRTVSNRATAWIEFPNEKLADTLIDAQHIVDSCHAGIEILDPSPPKGLPEWTVSIPPEVGEWLDTHRFLPCTVEGTQGSLQLFDAYRVG